MKTVVSDHYNIESSFFKLRVFCPLWRKPGLHSRAFWLHRLNLLIMKVGIC